MLKNSGGVEKSSNCAQMPLHPRIKQSTRERHEKTLRSGMGKSFYTPSVRRTMEKQPRQEPIQAKRWRGRGRSGCSGTGMRVKS